MAPVVEAMSSVFLLTETVLQMGFGIMAHSTICRDSAGWYGMSDMSRELSFMVTTFLGPGRTQVVVHSMRETVVVRLAEGQSTYEATRVVILTHHNNLSLPTSGLISQARIIPFPSPSLPRSPTLDKSYIDSSTGLAMLQPPPHTKGEVLRLISSTKVSLYLLSRRTPRTLSAALTRHLFTDGRVLETWL